MKPSTVLRDIKNRSRQLKFDFLVFVDVLHLLCQPHGRAICYKLGNAKVTYKATFSSTAVHSAPPKNQTL